MTLLSRTNRSMLSQWWWTVDRVVLVTVLTLMAIGIVMVSAASPSVANRIGLGDYHFIMRHLVVLIPSLFLFIGLSFLNIQHIWRLSLVMFIGAIIALIAVLLFGMEIKGAQRWIHLPGFSLQPSEFAKPAFIVVASWFLAREKEVRGFPGMKIAVALYALLVGLLLLQPDVGMSVVTTFCFLMVVFLSGLPFRYVFLMIIGAIGAALLAYFVFPHVQSRVDRFLFPDSGDTFQVEKSLAAFKSGGFFGQGLGQGVVKLSIPDAHADFVFAVAAEEFGFVFLIFIVGLYSYLIWRTIERSAECQDLFVMLAVSSLMGMIGLQALIHMGSSLSLLPTKGMTLPFLSYGGSSLLSVSMTMGIVLGLTKHKSKKTVARKGLSLHKF